MSLALDLAAGDSAWQTALVAVVLVMGYVVIFALWWFVFREKKE